MPHRAAGPASQPQATGQGQRHEDCSQMTILPSPHSTLSLAPPLNLRSLAKSSGMRTAAG